MKTVRIKTVCDGMDVFTSQASPRAPLGDFRGSSVQIREVVNVPEGTNAIEVIRLFAGTADISQFYGEPRLVFDYAELGIGKILR